MKENLFFRFIITYLFTVGVCGTIKYFDLIEISLSDVLLFGFLTSFFYIIFSIDKKIKNTDELVKNNYWQLKNEIKRKVNGKEKNNRGKQVL